MTYGIEWLNVYGGRVAIPVAEILRGRGLDVARFDNLMMPDAARSVALPFEDPVTNGANAARPMLDLVGVDGIELLITATESGVDYSKSVASHLHRHLGLPSTCRLVEVKQACYAATAALQLAVGHLATRASAGAKALVIATDVAVVGADGEYAEPATGSGAVAMLVGADGGVLAIDPGAYGLHSFDTFDSARPLPDRDVVDVDRSLMAYLECLRHSVTDYLTKVADADLRTTFDYLALHTPFPAMVKAAHRSLLRDVTGASAEVIERDFAERVAPSLHYPSLVGNLFSGSLYLALAALIDAVQPARDCRVGLFSYGSGCSSEFFSGVIGAESARRVGKLRIAEGLARRRRIDFAQYLALLPAARAALVPVEHRQIDLDQADGSGPTLALTAVRNYNRHYEWLGTGG
jgi:polyketide biosynthesis 3-hydroxy-3-methylglutaryl-CoA synthase-like enzyme PksG